MISAWKRRDNYWTNIDSPDFVQEQMYTGYLETRRHGLSGLDVHKKNDLWMLWKSAPKPLRQEVSADTRFVMWGCTDIPGGGSPAGLMQEVRESEAGGTGLDCRQSLLYEEVCPLCRAEVSDDDYTGRSEGVEAGLAYGEGIGQRIHAETVSTESCCSAWGNRDRRGILTERAYLSDYNQRLGEGTAHLVWRLGSV
jgi:hypothetical protein